MAKKKKRTKPKATTPGDKALRRLADKVRAQLFEVMQLIRQHGLTPAMKAKQKAANKAYREVRRAFKGAMSR